MSRHSWANLEVTRRGRENPDDIILIGAHYDSVIGSPGANDNATGVAALLELSRLAAARNLGTAVRFVAFVNEEPPHFQTAQMGSRVYAKQARARGDRIRAMLSLETLGYYSEAPASQGFPFPSVMFRRFYPDRGNFVLFVSNFGSRPLLRQAVELFRAQSDFPVESIATFELVPGVDWSDHSSFWAEGYPALMVTDTALYRYPYYHTEQDTPEKVNYGALARIVDGLAGMLWALGR
jgi:Zn-dependent M28 family amino/carboxypeptidase